MRRRKPAPQHNRYVEAVLLLYGNFNALFCKVLCSACIVRNVSDGGSKLKAEFCALAVLLCDGIDVVKNGGNEGVDGIVGNIVIAEDNCCNSNRVGIFGEIVGCSRNSVLAVVRGESNQLVCLFIFNGDEVNIAGSGEVSDGSGGSTGNDEGCVNLVVLQGFSAVCEALVYGVDVIFGKAVNTENVNCVEVNAVIEPPPSSSER